LEAVADSAAVALAPMDGHLLCLSGHRLGRLYE
jgi:hypothetical protein